MPSENSKVEFKFGTKAEYQSLDHPDPSTLYFLSDTQELYLGDKSYGGGGGGEIDWQELIISNNIHYIVDTNEPEDQKALWIKYNNSKNYPRKVVSNNLPYRDDQGHKNDITALYNSSLNLHPVEDVYASFSMGAAFVEFNNQLYMVGGLQYATNGESGTTEYLHGIYEFNGNLTTSTFEDQTVCESIPGLTRQAIIDAGFTVNNYSDEEDFSARAYTYQKPFTNSGHTYIAEFQRNEYSVQSLLVYELTYSSGEFNATIKYYSEEFFSSLSTDFKEGVLNPADNSLIFVENNTLKILIMNTTFQEFTLDLTTFEGAVSEYVYSEEDEEFLENLGSPLVFSTVGHEDGKYYVFLLGVSGSTSIKTNIVTIDFSQETNKFTLIGETTNAYLVQPSVKRENDIITLYGNLILDVTTYQPTYGGILQVDLSDDSFSETILEAENTNLGCQIVNYDGDELVIVGNHLAAFDMMRQVILISNIDINAYEFTLIVDSILLCNGNMENTFTIYDVSGNNIEYPIDYVLIPNQDESAYIEADAYLYENNEWTKLGGND